MKLVKIVKVRKNDSRSRIDDWYRKNFPYDDVGLRQLRECPATFEEVFETYEKKGEQAAFDEFYPCDTAVANHVFNEVERRLKRRLKRRRA